MRTARRDAHSWRPAQSSVIVRIESNLEDPRSLGDALVVRYSRARLNNLHVPRDQLRPPAGGGVVMAVGALEDDRDDLEAGMVVQSEFEVLGEVSVRPVEERGRGAVVGLFATRMPPMAETLCLVSLRSASVPHEVVDTYTMVRT